MLSEDHPNAVLARSLWTALADGDGPAVRDLLDEQVVWRASGHNPLSGAHRGRDAVIDYIARAGETADDLRSSLQAVYTSDDGVVLAHHIAARRGARVLDMDFLLRLEVRGGRIVRALSLPADQQVNDDFWS